MSEPTRPRILLADDDEVTREILGTMLERSGFACVAVADGNEAVTRTLSGEFAAAILDYEMPRLSGLEATLRIRRMEGHRKTPIIVLSSHTEKRDRVLGAGANAYLVKPVTPATLRATLSSWTSGGDLGIHPTFAPGERPADVVELFFEVVPERLARMRESAERQDNGAARAEAHRLIGSCAVLGFLRMAALARKVASGEIAAAAGAAQLETELERAFVQLSRTR
jgi:two-component system, sensor histidine kinase and response regulator